MRNLITTTGYHWLLRGIAVVWTVIFTFLLLQPEQQAVINTVIQPAPPSLQRELFFTALHLVTFGFTAWVWCLALFPPLKNRYLIVIPGLILVIYGATAELLQMHIPGRTPQWWDMTANVIGILLGIALWITGQNVLESIWNRYPLRYLN